MANISENLSTVKQSLIDIKNAIIDKGVTPTGNITTYAEAIDQLCLCGGGETIEGTELCIENVGSSGTFSISKYYSSTTNFPNLQLKLNNGNWFTYGFSVGGTTQITIKTGDKLYLRGDNPNGFSTSITNGFSINCTFNYNLSGYITSLISTTDFNTITDIPNYSFFYLFAKQNTLLNAKDLITDNIINVGQNTFQSCFYNCTNLITAPSFTNVTTVDYTGFKLCFNGCTSLITAPNFDKVVSVGEDGFYQCFNSCTSLITAPSFNNVTTVGRSGFNQCFHDCTNLITAPSFNNVTIVYENEFMTCFEGCTSLITAPSFTNVTTVGDGGFFSCFEGCTSLTIPPNFNNVNSVGADGFEVCFYGCNKLQVIYTPNITTWDENAFDNWVNGVASTGVLFKSETLEIPTGVNGIPDGWTTIIKN